MGSQGSEALTLEAFLAMCEAAPEGVRYEAVGGRAVMMSGPTHAHQLAMVRIVKLLDDALPDDLLVLPAPVDWVLWQVPALTLRQPDVVVMSVTQYGQQPLTSPPVLVLEILSPSTRAVDLRAKRAEYARAGAPHYWVVDIDVPSVEALTLDPATGGYRTLAHAAGDAVLAVTEPFAVAVTPAELVAKGGGPWVPKATRH
jgi:Uma2 family endonuclease